VLKVVERFFEVYNSSDTGVNAFTFVDFEDQYPISYVTQIGFIVHPSDKGLEFRYRGLFVADWSDHRFLNTIKK
jgi:hypothetical protein